jgi:hypothetical protein
MRKQHTQLEIPCLENEDPKGISTSINSKFHVSKNENPEGISTSSPRLPGTGYLGLAARKIHQP